jgi:AcrR family transcriptional regulator
MVEKSPKNQQVVRRKPQQERALEKVELMLEAARRILDKHGLAGLNTNRVAEVAGVSIGTVYQYFHDKSQLLDALAERELKALTDSILAVLQAYGGRTGVHRLLVEHLLAHTGATPLPGMREAIVQIMSQKGIIGSDHRVRALTPADAFVLTHSVAGVIRALLAAPNRFDGAQLQAIEDALVRLVVTTIDRDSVTMARD